MLQICKPRFDFILAFVFSIILFLELICATEDSGNFAAGAHGVRSTPFKKIVDEENEQREGIESYEQIEQEQLSRKLRFDQMQLICDKLKQKYNVIVQNNYNIPLQQYPDEVQQWYWHPFDQQYFVEILRKQSIKLSEIHMKSLNNWIQLDNYRPMFIISETDPVPLTSSYGISYYDKQYIVSIVNKRIDPSIPTATQTNNNVLKFDSPFDEKYNFYINNHNGNNNNNNNHINASPVFVLPFKSRTITNIEDREVQDILKSNPEIKSFEYIKRTNINRKDNYGKIINLHGYYTQDMMSYMNAMYQSHQRHKPLILFGDNDIDKYRSSNEKRRAFGGQASILGKYDRTFGYGITTTFFKAKFPSLNEFKHLMNKEFEQLEFHLRRGNDILIPCPTNSELNGHSRNKFYDAKTGRQIIFHNLGTGIANLPMNYLLYIQKKIDNLIVKFSSNFIHMDAKFYPISSELLKFEHNIRVAGLPLPIYVTDPHSRLNDEYVKNIEMTYGRLNDEFELNDASSFKFNKDITDVDMDGNTVNIDSFNLYGNRLLNFQQFFAFMNDIIGSHQLEIVPSGLTNFIQNSIMNSKSSWIIQDDGTYTGNDLDVFNIDVAIHQLWVLHEALFMKSKMPVIFHEKNVNGLDTSWKYKSIKYTNDDFIWLTKLIQYFIHDPVKIVQITDYLSKSIRDEYHHWLEWAIKSNFDLSHVSISKAMVENIIAVMNHQYGTTPMQLHKF